jgi:Tfp pilus assembly protein PilF
MAPGYDRPDHEGVLRRIRHECMFCHNAYPQGLAAEPLSYWRPQTFPANLPEGLGCQRCHGPGLEHVNAAKAVKAAKTTSKLDWKVIRASIVNPSRLPRQQRNDVCYECHMQPSVVLSGMRRFGRDIYSFRPGQLLSDYVARLDITEADQAPHERFEINHHPYRMEQSKCFIESEGELSCLTCHDPHKKVAEADRAAHYRKACMSCHATPHHVDRDCTTCHMPARRTQDVVHVVMTDHFIRRTPGGPELLAPREEREPLIESIRGNENELYRLIPLIRALAGSNASHVRRLEQLMAEAKPAEVEPYLDLAMGQLKQRRYAQLEQTARTILAKAPDQPLAIEWLGLARAAQARKAEEAIRALEQVTKKESRPESEFNLGVFLAGRGRTEEAMARYRRALAARPNFVAAWVRLGEAQLECGFREEAMESFRKALAIDPTNERARLKLTSLLPPA